MVSSWVLNVSKNGDSTTFLGNLFHAHFVLLKTRVVVLPFALFPPLRILISTISWLLQSRLLLTFTSLTSSSFFVSTKSRRVPLLVSSSITCVRNWSSMDSRNNLNCLCPIVFCLQQISEWLTSLMWTRMCKPDTPSSCLKKSSSISAS